VINLIDKDPLVKESRNLDGKTPLMLSIEHERHNITEHLLTSVVDITKRESRQGNTALHIACKKGDVETAKKIFNKDNKLCLLKNFDGNTSIHLATQSKALPILLLFE
jgi:ankyrin repeat protein